MRGKGHEAHVGWGQLGDEATPQFVPMATPIISSLDKTTTYWGMPREECVPLRKTFLNIFSFKKVHGGHYARWKITCLVTRPFRSSIIPSIQIHAHSATSWTQKGENLEVLYSTFPQTHRVSRASRAGGRAGDDEGAMRHLPQASDRGNIHSSKE